jgi:hypothetical protein
MGAYLHYGLISKLFAPANPQLSTEESDAEARKRFQLLIPHNGLEIAKTANGYGVQVPENLLHQHLNDFIQRFKNLYSPDHEDSWSWVLAQNWDAMSLKEIKELAKQTQSEHFWFDETPFYIQRSRLNMELLILQSEGKVACEYLDGALELLTRLIRKELAPNPLASFFYVWIS